MVVTTPSRKSNFWRDFLGGLAGPGTVPAEDVSNHVADLVAEAKADVVGRINGLTPITPPTDQIRSVPSADWDNALVVASMFDALAELARSGDGEMEIARNLYRSIGSLAGAHATNSTAYHRIGRCLGPSTASASASGDGPNAGSSR